MRAGRLTLTGIASCGVHRGYIPHDLFVGIIVKPIRAAGDPAKHLNFGLADISPSPASRGGGIYPHWFQRGTQVPNRPRRFRMLLLHYCAIMQYQVLCLEVCASRRSVAGLPLLAHTHCIFSGIEPDTPGQGRILDQLAFLDQGGNIGYRAAWGAQLEPCHNLADGRRAMLFLHAGDDILKHCGLLRCQFLLCDD